MSLGSDAFARSAVRKFHAQLMRYLGYRLKSTEDARDLAQEVYLRLLAVDEAAVKNPLQFLLVCASRVLADFHDQGARERKRLGKMLSVQSRGHLSDSSQEEPMELVELERDAIRAIRMLDRVRRRVFVLRAIHGEGYAAIAAQLGLTEETTKLYYFQAAAQVRAAIRQK